MDISMITDIFEDWIERSLIVALIILAVFILINYIIASHFSEVAEEKGHNSKFMFCFFFGFIGWIYVLALPDLVARENQENLIEVQNNILLTMQNNNNTSNTNNNNPNGSNINGSNPIIK